MSVKIDCREIQLIGLCKTLIESDKKFSDVSINTENLLIGDIIIRGCDESHSVVIERKSFSDLSASIKDGRYKEQSLRLSSSEYHNHNIIYLIEGSWTPGFQSSHLGIDTLYGSIISLSLLKGFSVIRTMNISDTASFICNLARKLKKTSMKMYYENYIKNDVKDDSTMENTILTSDVSIPPSPNKVSYTSVIKIKKKDNITPDNIGVIMLSQIPSVNNITAETIINEYKSIKNLITELQTNPDGLRMLKYTTNNGQQRKINKPACDNIIAYLLPSTTNTK
jgi:ERCC4-type nuclease